MNLAEIRKRDRNAIPRFKNPNLPEDDPHNAFLQAEMDRRWLLAKIDMLVDSHEEFVAKVRRQYRGL